MGFFGDTIEIKYQAMYSRPSLPPHNFLTYWKATR